MSPENKENIKQRPTSNKLKILTLKKTDRFEDNNFNFIFLCFLIIRIIFSLVTEKKKIIFSTMVPKAMEFFKFGIKNVVTTTKIIIYLVVEIKKILFSTMTLESMEFFIVNMENAILRSLVMKRNTRAILKANIEHFKQEFINSIRNLFEKFNTEDAFIEIPLDVMKKDKVRVLVDTGADISLIKLNSLKDGIDIDKSELRVISGVYEGDGTTIGTIQTTLKINDEQLLIKLHVVDNTFSIPADGIIGRDLLWGNTIINTKQKLIKFYGANADDNFIVLPLMRRNNCKINKQIFFTCDEINIPARTQKVVNVNACGKNKNVLVESEEILPGIFVANSISAIRDNILPVLILNSTTQNINLNGFIPKYTCITNFEILDKKENDDCVQRQNNINYVKNEPNCNNRIDILKTMLRFSPNLNHEEKTSIFDLCLQFNNIFYLEGDKLTSTDVTTHSIQIKTDQPPINQKMYRLPLIHKHIIEDQVSKMLSEDIIQVSKSPWNSPLIVVPKKPGSDGQKRWRVVVDFRKLNAVTVKDAYPLPRIEDILDQLGHSRYFSTLDLASGYHQVSVEPVDRPKTAFSTPKGHYEFKRMPFGLTGAPATFQRMMNHILTGISGFGCFVYLDDIVVYGKNLKDHNDKLQEVFIKIREHGLKLQTEKCNFLSKEIIYLGHKCSVDGVLPDPSRIEAVQKFPRPSKVRDVQSFLGLLNYYRKFIQNFSKIASPINNLLKKDTLFEWTEECESSFKELKGFLVNPPLLIYPDFDLPFNLTTDASKLAIGAVLSQSKVGLDKPIAYASRSLSKTEQNYSTTEKELLAIVWAVKNFRSYLLGHKFYVYTDHQPLRGECRIKDPSSRIIRLYQKLMDYDFCIEYKKGALNTNADALSRVLLDEGKYVGVVETRSKTKEKSNEIENDINEIDIDALNEENEIEYLIDPVEIKTVLKDFHDSPLGGHLGMSKTYQRIRRQYKWKNMQRDVNEYIRNCIPCQRNKCSLRTKMPMEITDTANSPFDKVYLDIVGPLPITVTGKKYILTFEDDLTRFMDCYALDNCEAETVAEAFYNEIISRYRIPKVLVTDQGANFVSDMFKRVCKFLKIKKLQTTAYHPQSNGALERCHRPLADYLRIFVEENPSVWDQWLRQAVHVHNNTPHSATRLTPMDCLFGFTAELPTNLTRAPEPIYNHENYFYKLKYKIQKAHEISRKNLLASKHISKRYYDRNCRDIVFEVGDLVFLENEARKNKLSPHWLGPYEVVEINSPVNSTIKMDKKLKRVHNNRIKIANL